jgi:hypothetical protein
LEFDGSESIPRNFQPPGGGVWQTSPFSYYTFLTFSNTATNGGGGIWVNNSSTLHVIDSTISNNTATNGNGGGGIYVNIIGTLNISNSTVSGNTATVVVNMRCVQRQRSRKHASYSPKNRLMSSSVTN